MSPTSFGSLEVERYIGACLITSQHQGRTRKGGADQRFQGAVDGWINGVPFLSYHQNRWRRPDGQYSNNSNPLRSLAVHTQGAPLILSSNRYSSNSSNNNRRKFQQSPPKSTNNYNYGKVLFDGSAVNRAELTGNVNADAISVTSDESSGSNNSETCLPRIIKPRKRRKKDRKPPHLLRPSSQDDTFSTDSASPDLDSPKIISFVPYLSYLSRKSDSTEFFSEPPPPNLHHSFEDLEDFDLNGNQAESSCQCRYCDPNGQIWDVDRSCYSPFLTPAPVKSYSSSFLDCFSSLTLDECKTSAPLASSRSNLGRDLEVSTEIVTSPNGHRDLEIKFFSQDSSRTKERPSGVVNNRDVVTSMLGE